jgi:hypothetical protein
MTPHTLRQRLESLLQMIKGKKWEHAKTEAERLNEDVGSASDSTRSAAMGALYESLLSGLGSACNAVAEKNPDLAEECVNAVILQFSGSDRPPSDPKAFPEVEG